MHGLGYQKFHPLTLAAGTEINPTALVSVLTEIPWVLRVGKSFTFGQLEDLCSSLDGLKESSETVLAKWRRVDATKCLRCAHLYKSPGR